jgi:phytoene synthase
VESLPDGTLQQLYEQAAEATARGSTSFHFAARLFPPETRRAAHAIYWYCRYTDDLVDKGGSLEELAEWEAQLASNSSHPVLALLRHTAAAHGIPMEYARELIRGVRMDLERTRYETFAELRVFCYRVASVVGLMMSHAIGFQPGAERHAIDLGIAMQLTNILRDIGEDLSLGRIYLPAEDLRRFNYSQEDLSAGKVNGQFRRLMRWQIARARSYYASAEPGIAMLHPRGRFAVRLAADLYSRILGRIEANDYDVFTKRAHLPRAQKYAAFFRVCAGF